MGRRVHVVIAEPSVIIRSGVISVLKKLNTLNIDVAEIVDLGSLETQICRYNPDILLINPSYLGIFSLQQIKSNTGCLALKTVALQHTLSDNVALKYYDKVISIYDTAGVIGEKLADLINDDTKTEYKLELSMREQEIVVCIAKGLSNKQIADELCLSAHTVMTHRRNIANKLQIHSPAGLTIYAIVNKLIDISEIKDVMNLKE